MNVNVLINQKWNELLVPSNFDLIWCLKIKTKIANIMALLTNSKKAELPLHSAGQ